MLKKDDFISFILDGQKQTIKKSPTAVPASTASDLMSLGFDIPATSKETTTDESSFAQKLLEASDFGKPEYVQTASLIRSTDSVAQHLPPRAAYWPKTPSRPYQTLLFETDKSHKDLLAIPAFKSRKMSHLDMVEDALARMVSEALDGFQRGGDSVTADVRKGKKEETLCIVSVKDEREQQQVRLVCFGTINAKSNGLETFHLTEQTRYWDQQLAKDHLGLLYERQFKKLGTATWQEAFTTSEERKQAEKLLEVCSKQSPQKTEIEENIINLLDTIAKNFGLRCRAGQMRRLQAFNLPSDHDIGIDPDEISKHGGRNPFGGVTLRDEKNRLLGYIVYPLRKKEDAAELRSYLEKNNRFHNVLVVFPDGDETTLELWQGTDQLSGKLRKDHGFHGAAEVVSLLSRFFVVSKAKVRNPSELAQELAYRARYLRRLAIKELEIEIDEGPIRNLYKAFKEALVHDQTEKEFADAFAQTLTYGLLTARWIGNDNLAEAGDRFTRQNALKYLPATSNFLRDLFKTALAVKLDDQRGRLLWLVDDIADLLDRIDVTYVFGIGDKNSDQATDPVIHFYEPFLAAYDNELRNKRGVFFTPRPVVSFIVRSVHELLQSEFGLVDGLASTETWSDIQNRFPDLKLPNGVIVSDPFICILDPATGTGTFYYECIELIERIMKDKWCKELKINSWKDPVILSLWSDYVSKHLLTRLYGFELMMASYSIAHLKLAIKLLETGYHFKDDDKLRVYLTNSLEQPVDTNAELTGVFPSLAQEAVIVNSIKRNKHFTVIVGNPPYSAVSANLTPANRRIVDRYRSVNGELIREKSMLQFEKNIQDDYIKFIALAHKILELSPLGVIGFVTNHSFIDGPTLRGMRWNLQQSFSKINLYDLHGNSNKKEGRDCGDENVFDIQQGVAISLLTRNIHRLGNITSTAHIWGPRATKYSVLSESSISSIKTKIVEAKPPSFYFLAFESDLGEEYNNFIPIDNIFMKNLTGTTTGFDDLLVDFDQNVLKDKLDEFCSQEIAHEFLHKKYSADKGHAASVLKQRKSIDPNCLDSFIKPFQLFPFDYRWGFMRKDLLQGHRFDVMENLTFGKPGLVAMRQTKERFGVFVVQGFCGHKILGSYDRSYIFPTFNLSPISTSTFIDYRILNNLPMTINDKDKGALDILSYSYSVFYSPNYQKRYAEFLKIDFPRLPLPVSEVLFYDMAKIGSQLIDLHLLTSVDVNNSNTRYCSIGDNLVSNKPLWKDNSVWINKSDKFEGITEEVWKYHIGGYQVCEKWLKDRKGRILSKDEILHYQKIVIAINETIRLTAEIDKVIETHGGWPGAFQSSSGAKA